ncbi:MAG: hypothetical protein D3923_10095 [Candidatus Electrothrix sp. AR3]|nr:hypothetical protein [Candidatus Electrothrix sp. AR3]
MSSRTTRLPKLKKIEGGKKMKVSKKKLTGHIFFSMIFVAIIFFAGSVATETLGTDLPKPDGKEMAVWEHCGCDDQKAIEGYVNNIIKDAMFRGMSCTTAKTHALACINVYCSICQGHPGLVESCVQTASNYFLNSSGFCQQQQPQSRTLALNFSL